SIGFTRLSRTACAVNASSTHNDCVPSRIRPSTSATPLTIATSRASEWPRARSVTARVAVGTCRGSVVLATLTSPLVGRKWRRLKARVRRRWQLDAPWDVAVDDETGDRSDPFLLPTQSPQLEQVEDAVERARVVAHRHRLTGRDRDRRREYVVGRLGDPVFDG